MKYNQVSLENFLGDFNSQINPSQSQIKIFKEHLATLHKTDPEESEEHHKNEINDFLKNTFAYKINTRNKIDAAIYEDNRAQVIIEAKSLKNKGQFPKNKNSLESKAFYESILYYLRESCTGSNNNIKYIILCNLHSFYIIDAKEFHKCFAKDREIDKFFKNVDKKEGNDTTTDKFYEEIRQYLPNLDKEISYTCFELTNIQDQDIALIYAVLSPTFLLKRKSYIDANTLNQGFYDELLYILGLCEKIESGKIIIVPSDTQNTFLYSITQNLGFDKEKDFEEIFSLLTIWNNRILFLRLLESMLLSFGHIKKPFLDLETIADFKVFNQLFFDVLAREEDSRTEIPRGLEDIPYLNSSLFEKTPLESENGKNKQIKSLDSKPLKLYKTSILKQNSEYKNKDSLPLLEYLFAFLHSYDFTTTPKDIENHTKMNFDKLINSAVLGLVFEKLNGYKEGSFYTPSFITSYMCRQSLEKIVIDKFNALKGWKCENIIDIKNHIGSNTRDIKEADEIFYQIKICDPAVGSGHYLVSALNELIYIKWRMGILCDEEYGRIEDIELRLDNDEIIITQNGKPFSYTIPESENTKSQIIQKAIFNTKRKIIENCLFGVDINPNSCEITRLRLWIELLKYSYYKDIAKGRLETLPNIDINIKAGNSLISNFPINTKLTTGLTNEFTRNLKTAIEDYKIQVNHYKEALQDKKFITDKISSIKTMLKNHFIKWNKRTQSLEKSVREFVGKYGEDIFKWEQNFGDSGFGFEIQKIITDSIYDEKGNPKSNPIKFQKSLDDKEPIKTLNELDKEGQKLLESIRSDFKYLESLRTSDSFEWRFEFPEVLDENGDFIGFDLLIGNPPYIRQELLKDIKPHLSSHFDIYSGTSDIYTYFFEQGYKVLRDGGWLSFITSNKWTRAGYGEKLRSFILEKTSLETYVEFNGVKVFDSATVDTSIVEFIKQTSKDHNFKYISITTKPKDATDITSTTPQLINTSTLSSEAFTFGDSATIALKQKIESIGTPLKDWDINIYRGILTGYNEAFIIDTTKKDEILSKCDDSKDSHLPFELIDGHYIRCEDKKDAILLTEKERTAQIIRPILRGKDIKRYSYEWADKWVIFIPWHFPNMQNPKSMEENEKDLSYFYPNLYKHLLEHKDKLSKRNKDETGIRYEWYCLQRWGSNYWNEFARQKIVYSEIVREPQFYLDNGDFKFGNFFAEATSFILTGEKINYLLGILNSKITGAIFKNFYAGGGLGESGYRYKKAFIEKLPIPKVDEEKEASFVSVVDEIIKCKKENKPTKDLEEKLDLMVFELYNLNETEIKSVLSLSLS